MAETLESIRTAMAHWHVEAANKLRDDASLRTSMQSLAADIDAAPSVHLRTGERSGLRARLERMVHQVGEPRALPAAPPQAPKLASTISVLA
jgi:hypothetical protein